MENREGHVDPYDYLQFPSRMERRRIRKQFDFNGLKLPVLENPKEINRYIYEAWRLDINNYTGKLEMYFLLMAHYYVQNPLKKKRNGNFSEEQNIMRYYFDTFSEMTAVYLISYYEKIVDMLKDIYKIGKNCRKRDTVIEKLLIIDNQSLHNLVTELKNIQASDNFKEMEMIRNNFVNNYSSYYIGIFLEEVNGYYCYGGQRGVTTESMYKSIVKMLQDLEKAAVKVTEFLQ